MDSVNKNENNLFQFIKSTKQKFTLLVQNYIKSKINFYSVKRELIEVFKYETMLGLFSQTEKRST